MRIEAPPRGFTKDGSLCTCFCHTRPGIKHFAPCCSYRPSEVKETKDGFSTLRTTDASKPI
jgi:hypothetical protein